MSNNPQQLNTADDSLEFDFDENDVLVKDGSRESVDLSKQPAPLSDTSIIKEQLGAPLDLKKVKTLKVAKKDIEEDLKKQASMQKEKIEALEREGEGLVYDEKDEEEIEKFKKNPLAKSGFNIDSLIRTLMSKLNIVSTLKIDLINRLKNIIGSFLRDVRAERATEELLQRSIESGGLNLSPEHTAQIMEFIKGEYKRIHLAVPIVVSSLKHENLEQKIKDEVADRTGEDTQAVSKKTAREAQVGVFSDEITGRDAVKRVKFSASGKRDLEQWEKGLAIPSNLRVPEISAAKSVKKLASGINKSESVNADFSEMGEEKELEKDNLILKNFKREEVLESLNKELAQDENKVQNLEKKKTSWFSKLFKQKPARSSKFKVESSKSIKQETKKQSVFDKAMADKKGAGATSVHVGVAGMTKKTNETQTLKQENDESKKVSSFKFQVPGVVRRVVQNKSDFDNRYKMEDVKVVHPHLVGPIEELAEMTLADFRRLGSTAQDSVDKIREKIEISAKEFFNQKIAAINAWRKSEPNRLYMELGRQSLLQKLSVEDLINQYNLENKPTLTKEEFDLISQLNRELRY